jgi:hypothetical protein
VSAGGTMIAHGLLNYMAGTAVTGLTGAAYTNNDLEPTTGTTLFNIDTSLNQVVIQSPPNAGSLMAIGQLTIDPDTAVGFDFYTNLRDDMAFNNRSFASLVVGGVSGFYRVNVLTGQAILIRAFNDSVVDIAIPLNQSSKELGTRAPKAYESSPAPCRASVAETREPLMATLLLRDLAPRALVRREAHSQARLSTTVS